MGEQSRGVLDGRAHALLWATLTLLLVVLMVGPDAPVVAFAPQLALGVVALGAAVGLAVVQFSLARFQRLGLRVDLCVGIGFGILGCAGVVLRLMLPETG